MDPALRRRLDAIVALLALLASIALVAFFFQFGVGGLLVLAGLSVLASLGYWAAFSEAPPSNGGHRIIGIGDFDGDDP